MLLRHYRREGGRRLLLCDFGRSDKAVGPNGNELGKSWFGGGRVVWRHSAARNKLQGMRAGKLWVLIYIPAGIVLFI